MKKIRITNEIANIASGYCNEMKSKPHFPNVNIDPWDRLTTLRNVINDAGTKIYYMQKVSGRAKKIKNKKTIILDKSPYILYIDKILLLLYSDLLDCLPSKIQFIVSSFESIINKNQLQQKIVIENKNKKKKKMATTFADILVDKMLYNEVRHHIFPKYVRQLNIKSCVYCNAAYAVTDKASRAYYDLDHFMPKSLYPYLCISFFNLQPSCPVCNRTKSNDDQLKFFSLYEESTTKELDAFNLDLEELSVARYLLSHSTEHLNIRFTAVRQEYETMRNDMDTKLHITDLYAEHIDVAEEVVWKRLAFDRGYLRLSKMSFGSFAPISNDVNRFILGTYINPEETHKRPMTRMIQGVAKQMGVL